MTDRSVRAWQHVRLTLPSGAAADLTDDPDAVDLDVVWEFIDTQAYWGGWLPREKVEAQVRGAWRVISAHVDGVMVGFARAVSDGVAVAYLADVFVAPSFRGGGIARAVLTMMIDDGPGADFRWMLHTLDAHDLYRPFGFTDPTDRYLERPPRRRDGRQQQPAVAAMGGSASVGEVR